MQFYLQNFKYQINTILFNIFILNLNPISTNQKFILNVNKK